MKGRNSVPCQTLHNYSLLGPVPQFTVFSTTHACYKTTSLQRPVPQPPGHCILYRTSSTICHLSLISHQNQTAGHYFIHYFPKKVSSGKSQASDKSTIWSAIQNRLHLHAHIRENKWFTLLYTLYRCSLNR